MYEMGFRKPIKQRNTKQEINMITKQIFKRKLRNFIFRWTEQRPLSRINIEPINAIAGDHIIFTLDSQITSGNGIIDSLTIHGKIPSVIAGSEEDDRSIKTIKGIILNEDKVKTALRLLEMLEQRLEKNRQHARAKDVHAIKEELIKSKVIDV